VRAKERESRRPDRAFAGVRRKAVQMEPARPFAKDATEYQACDRCDHPYPDHHSDGFGLVCSRCLCQL